MLHCFVAGKLKKLGRSSVNFRSLLPSSKASTGSLSSCAALSLATMASCEPHRTSAYREDLRWRMVWQCEALGYTHASVAENLGVDRSTIYWTLQLFHTTGSICKKLYPKEKAFRKLTTPAQLLILNLVVMKPGIYLQEIQDELQNVLLLTVDISTICRFLLNN